MKDTLKIVDKNILKLFPPLDIDSTLIPDFLSEKTLFKVKWDMIDTVEACYYDLYEDDINQIKERKLFIQYFLKYISDIL